MKKIFLIFFVWVFINIPLLPQNWTMSETLSIEDDPALYIGFSLEELIGEFGIPRSVYPVRGLVEWDDDVVFVYDEGDFYIIKDRVWQLGLSSAYLIQVGDSRPTVLLRFGQAINYGEEFVIYSLGGYSWPIALRFNFDSAGRVTAIFVYRSDI